MARREDDRQNYIIDARAPMHDPSTNIPMTRPSGTPAGIWNKIFQNSRIGEGLAPAGNPVTMPGAGALPANPFQGTATLNRAGNPLTLSTLAAGGENHAQTWERVAAQKPVTPLGNLRQGQVNVAPWVDMNGPMRTSLSAPGTARQPYIAGANGDVTKDFVAGGRYSSYKAGSDKTLDTNQFRWASGYK